MSTRPRPGLPGPVTMLRPGLAVTGVTVRRPAAGAAVRFSAAKKR